MMTTTTISNERVPILAYDPGNRMPGAVIVAAVPNRIPETFELLAWATLAYPDSTVSRLTPEDVLRTSAKAMGWGKKNWKEVVGDDYPRRAAMEWFYTNQRRRGISSLVGYCYILYASLTGWSQVPVSLAKGGQHKRRMAKVIYGEDRFLSKGETQEAVDVLYSRFYDRVDPLIPSRSTKKQRETVYEALSDAIAVSILALSDLSDTDWRMVG